MASSEQVQMLERRIVMSVTVVVFLVVLATFAGILFTHRNTSAIVDPLIRRMRPAASPAEIERLHNIARKMGHFLIPAGAFALLVIGPLRKRPVIALALCALFATIDEWLQTFTPGRNGSLDDVILDTSGALFAYFVYRVITSWRGTAKLPPSGHMNPPDADTNFGCQVSIMQSGFDALELARFCRLYRSLQTFRLVMDEPERGGYIPFAPGLP